MVNINELVKATLVKLFGEQTKYKLLGISPMYGQDASGNQDRSKEIGKKVLCAEMSRVLRLTVKVEGGLGVDITNEDVLASESDIWVTFEDSKVTFYGERITNAQMSITATKMNIVDDKQDAQPKRRQQATQA